MLLQSVTTVLSPSIVASRMNSSPPSSMTTCADPLTLEASIRHTADDGLGELRTCCGKLPSEMSADPRSMPLRVPFKPPKS